ncbi:MAG: leucyl aminopeptidase family protein [Candidatus Aenigmatarchaeota archaeon]
MVEIKVEVIDKKAYPLIEIVKDERFGKEFLKGFNFKITYENQNQIIYVSYLKNEMKLASKILDLIKSLKLKEVCIDLSNLNSKKLFVESLYLSAYEFDKYKSNKQKESIKIHAYGIEKIELIEAKIISKAVYIARDLGNEPANQSYPEAFVRKVYEIFEEEPNVLIEVLDEKDLERENLRGILLVGNSSIHKPRLLILKYFGLEKNFKPIMLVGKGVCFDAGGINVKPAESMYAMYVDKSGAANVVGIFYAVAKLKIPINLVGLIPLVENVISERSTKPGDIEKIGDKYVEIVHTDAEGRLILADAIQYGIKKFDPEIIIDMATLTGAQIVALGYKIAAMYSNNNEIAKELFKIGKEIKEYVWRMPLPPFYKDLIKSERADIKNVPSPISREAGSIVGAMFIKEFVSNKKWIHLDIAGPAIYPKKEDWLSKDATGFGVRLIINFLQRYSKRIS